MSTPFPAVNEDKRQRCEGDTEPSQLAQLFALANNMANNAEVLIQALQPYAPLQVVHKSIVQQVAWLQESVDNYHAFAQAVHDAHGGGAGEGKMSTVYFDDLRTLVGRLLTANQRGWPMEIDRAQAEVAGEIDRLEVEFKRMRLLIGATYHLLPETDQAYQSVASPAMTELAKIILREIKV